MKMDLKFKPTQTLRRYSKNNAGSAAIETAFTLPIVFVIFFSCIQVVLLMLDQATLESGINDVVASYEEMYIREQTPFTEVDMKTMICAKMVLGNSCNDRLHVQLHSYSNSNVDDIKIARHNNQWSELEEYYVSFVRVDYVVPTIIPYFSMFMRSPEEDYTLSFIFTVSPSKIRNGALTS